MQLLLQDKYNIGVLTVNIECMWLSTKRMEKLAKSRLSPVSKPRHINSKLPSIHQYCIYPAIKVAHTKNVINLIIKKR